MLAICLAGLWLVQITPANAADNDSNGLQQVVESYRKQGYTVKSVTPIFGQLLMMGFPQGFKSVFENTSGPQYIREAVLDGENEKKWTQMITITGVKGLASNPNASPKKFAEGMAGGFQRACPTTFSAAAVLDGKLGTNDAFVAVMSCGTSPTTNGSTSETALVAVIKGESDYYTVQWAERAEPSNTPIAIDSKKWVEKLNLLAPIKLCPIVPGEPSPYLSCAAAK